MSAEFANFEVHRSRSSARTPLDMQHAERNGNPGHAGH